jgi:CheY-like chemotaxis protein
MDTRIPVLIVEEEPFLRETLAEIFEDEGWAEPFAAKNEAEALRVLRDLGAPCLVLADLVLATPDAEGFLDEVSHSKERPGLGLVLISGLPLKQFERALKHPIDGVLFKPFDLNELLELLVSLRDRVAKLAAGQAG